MEPSNTVSAEEQASALATGAHGPWADLHSLVHDHLTLLSLEAQRAGRSVGAIVTFSIAAGLLASGTWLGFMVAIVLWLTEHQMNTSTAILLASTLSAFASFGFALGVCKTSRSLGFAGTLRSLHPIQPNQEI